MKLPCKLAPFRSLLALSRAAAFLALTRLAATAFAAGEKDKAALKLHDPAMNDDYLAVEFAKAHGKLKKTPSSSAARAIAPPRRARQAAHALGTVSGVG